jgi:D-alanyl-D-alanine carboxypeptidase
MQLFEMGKDIKLSEAIGLRKNSNVSSAYGMIIIGDCASVF